MSDLTMDLSTNDLLVTNGDLSIVKGTDAIVQDLQQTLQVWAGEWFLDTTVGVPYKQQILVKNPNLDLVQADLLNAALNVPGITEVTDFNFNYDPNNRSLSVQLVANTSNGQTIQVQTQVNSPVNATIEGTPYP